MSSDGRGFCPVIHGVPMRHWLSLHGGGERFLQTC